MRLKTEAQATPARLSDELSGPEAAAFLLLGELCDFGATIHKSSQLLDALDRHLPSEIRIQFFREAWEGETVRRPGEPSDFWARLFLYFEGLVRSRWLTWTVRDPVYRFTPLGAEMLSKLKEEQPKLARRVREVAALYSFDSTEEGWRLLGERMGWTAQAAS